MILVMVFNIISPMAIADGDATDGTMLMCTSVGYVKVSLAKFNSDDLSSITKGIETKGMESDDVALLVAQQVSDHCPYCKLFDSPDGRKTDLAPYPAPDSKLELHYQSVLATRASQHITHYTRLRAPPISTALFV